jgi:hypothetical protein
MMMMMMMMMMMTTTTTTTTMMMMEKVDKKMRKLVTIEGIHHIRQTLIGCTSKDKMVY